MPRLLPRQEPPADDHVHFWCDALLIDGNDPSAAWRARVRALNTSRQALERLTGDPLNSSGQPGGYPLAAGGLAMRREPTGQVLEMSLAPAPVYASPRA